jgi:hypothetical protein
MKTTFILVEEPLKGGWPTLKSATSVRLPHPCRSLIAARVGDQKTQPPADRFCSKPVNNEGSASQPLSIHLKMQAGGPGLTTHKVGCPRSGFSDLGSTISPSPTGNLTPHAIAEGKTPQAARNRARWP